MSEILELEAPELELLEFGSQVAIIDDRRADAQPIEDAFNNLNIGNQFFEVDFIQPKFPNHPLENVKLVFLDLHYNEAFGAAFEPYVCADWLKHIVPQGRKYTLVVWSRDVEKTDELVEAIIAIGAPLPFSVDRKSKPEYLKENVQDNIEKMLVELGITTKGLEIDVKEFYGKILEVEDDSVLINCLLNENPKIFEVRRFDLLPFTDYIQLIPGKFVHIKITTKPGSKTIEFTEENSDLAEMFIKPDNDDDYKDPETIDWLNIP